MGLNEVLSDLADKANYAVQTFHLGAVSVDAPHRRMRLWIVARNVADANRLNRRAVQEPQRRRKENPIKRQSPSNSSSDVADAISARGETWASDTVGDGDGSRSNKNSLRVAVAKQMWPTPNASDSKQANMKDGHDIKKGYLRGVVKMYPTPTASLEKHSTKEAYWENRIQKGRQEDIQMRVYKETGSGIRADEPPVGRVAYGIPKGGQT